MMTAEVFIAKLCLAIKTTIVNDLHCVTLSPVKRTKHEETYTMTTVTLTVSISPLNSQTSFEKVQRMTDFSLMSLLSEVNKEERKSALCRSPH